MHPIIKTSAEKKLIGKSMIMSLSDNKTGDLWRSFISQKTEIKNNIGTELYSLQCYPKHYFTAFSPDTTFEKWAALEVSDFETVPDTMLPLVVTEGLYAVFNYKGSSNDTHIFQYIFRIWLPDSGYELDDRLHFEILGEKYKNDTPDSEEEIWIPVKPKQ